MGYDDLGINFARKSQLVYYGFYMEIAIHSIGTATPMYRQSQVKVADFMSARLNLTPAEKRRLRMVYQATGIEFRHSVIEDFIKETEDLSFFPNNPLEDFPGTKKRMEVYNKNALPLAIKAIQNAISSNNFNKTTLTHIITVSCTGMSAPGLDIGIIQELGLPSTIHRTNIHFMGCYAAFNGIKMAHAICKADPNAIVLVVCLELCSIHFQKPDSVDKLISTAIFADGASAAIIQANPNTSKYLSLNHFYCDIIPQTQQEMTWGIGDKGFDIILSSYVPELIQSGIADFFDRLYQKSGLSKDKIQFFAIHPGSKKILEACEKALDISKEDNQYAYEILRQYGNMSSATILFILKKLLDNLKTKDHRHNIFSCAFGPGLTIESMLMQVHCV